MGKTEKPIKNLFLIGNGFDRWQGLQSSYEDFRKYYCEHISDVMREMSINYLEIKSEEGVIHRMTPVDLVFGNPFRHETIPAQFFWQLEESMDKIDDQLLNAYFGRESKSLKKLNKTLSQAKRILQKLFSDWIVSLNVDPAPSITHSFGQDCVFINFNYTDTLEKRFGVDPDRVFHIHGEAAYPATIIVGHAAHPEKPFDELLDQKLIHLEDGGRSPRLEGLYYVENILYETDKHIRDNLNQLFLFFAKNNIHIEDIEHIYVLGMSLSDPDMEYIKYLFQATKCGCDFNELTAWGSMKKSNPFERYNEDDLYHDIALNIAYASHRRTRVLHMDDLPYPEAEAKERAMNRLIFGREEYYDADTAEKAKQSVHRRFLLEQAARDKEAVDQLCRDRKRFDLIGTADYPSVLSMMNLLDGGHCPRTADAEWILSFHSEKDRDHIMQVMKKIGCANYRMEPSIDNCLAQFRQE